MNDRIAIHIFHDCRKECVECRTPYPKEPRRHRYMEKEGRYIIVNNTHLCKKDFITNVLDSHFQSTNLVPTSTNNAV